MKIFKTDYSTTGAFSPLITDYLAQDSKLKPFYHRFPELSNFEAQIKEKEQLPINRELLVQVLQEQYGNLAEAHSPAALNILRLAQPNTFTVTTGHQLNIFTGPCILFTKLLPL
jgi:uncharacterized protein YllA (UPF0747 family)